MAVPALMHSHEKQDLTSPIKLSSHGDIFWLRDSAGIFVFSPHRQKYWLLAGLEADLWDWLVLGHTWDDMVERFALMTDVQENTAREGIFRFVRYLLREEIWVEAS